MDRPMTAMQELAAPAPKESSIEGRAAGPAFEYREHQMVGAVYY